MCLGAHSPFCVFRGGFGFVGYSADRGFSIEDGVIGFGDSSFPLPAISSHKSREERGLAEEVFKELFSISIVRLKVLLYLNDFVFEVSKELDVIEVMCLCVLFKSFS